MWKKQFLRAGITSFSIIIFASCSPPSSSWQSQGGPRIIENKSKTLGASGRRYNTDADPPTPRRRYKRERNNDLFLNPDLAAQSLLTPRSSRPTSLRPSIDFSQSPIQSPEKALTDFGDKPQQEAIQLSQLPRNISPDRLSAYPKAVIDVVEGLVTPFRKLFPECIAHRFLEEKAKNDQVDDELLFKSCDYYLDMLRIRIAEFNRLNGDSLFLDQEFARSWFYEIRESAQTRLSQLKQYLFEDKPFMPPRHPALLAQELLQ